MSNDGCVPEDSSPANCVSILIRNAGLLFSNDIVDVRIAAGRIAAVGAFLPSQPTERVVEAHGAALLPGLHDHHIHLQALAMARNSLRCALPDGERTVTFASRLRAAGEDGPEDQWLRGTGYHESIAGDIDRDWLDACVASRPVRIQHRSGRLWLFNSRALNLLGGDEPGTPLERKGGRLTGRLYDGDAWLRQRLGSQRPSLDAPSRQLASYGITGITDVTHTNSLADFHHFQHCQRRGELRQRVMMMGDASLGGANETALLSVGPTKIHLHEHALPEFRSLCEVIARSHRAGRPVAVHCVTVAELAFALAALSDAGRLDGDRIEHASVVPDDWLPELCSARVTVVTQPHFVLERGDTYVADIPAAELAWLYRARTLIAAGVPLAGGTDAPFGHANPWLAMQSAVDRRTARGRPLGSAESLSPEEACALFLGPASNPGTHARTIHVGAVADICLLDRRWLLARHALAQVRVALCLRHGETISEALPK